MSVVRLRRAQIGKSSGGLDVTVKSSSGWAAAFAPTWEMVSGYKAGRLSDAAYGKLYEEILDRAGAEAFRRLHACGSERGGSLTLLCYCPGGRFCHTHLLIDHAVRKYGELFSDGRRKRAEKDEGRHMKHVLAIDLETTGLKAGYHEITEIGALLLDKTLQELGAFETLVRIDHPERGLEGGFDVFEYTHIDPKDLEQAPKLKECLRNLETFVRGHTNSFSLGEVVIFWQNPRFDCGFLEAAYDSLGWKFPYDFHVIGLESVFAFHQFQKNGTLPDGIRLKDICKKTGVKNEKAHSAIADIRATVESLRALIGG